MRCKAYASHADEGTADRVRGGSNYVPDLIPDLSPGTDQMLYPTNTYYVNVHHKTGFLFRNNINHYSHKIP